MITISSLNYHYIISPLYFMKLFIVAEHSAVIVVANGGDILSGNNSQLAWNTKQLLNCLYI
jgi:hypothetical protein